LGEHRVNDFTLNELKDIHACVDLGKYRDGFDDALLEKIEHMIDRLEKQKLRKKIIEAINSCKAYGTKESEMMIFAYQNVLKWMATLHTL
jgi:hypothetical protein